MGVCVLAEIFSPLPSSCSTYASLYHLSFVQTFHLSLIFFPSCVYSTRFTFSFLKSVHLNTLAAGNIYMVVRDFRKFFNSIFYSVASLSGILKREQSLSPFEHCFLSDIKFLPFLKKIEICTSFIYFWQISRTLGN